MDATKQQYLFYKPKLVIVFFFRTRRFIFLVNMYTSLDNNSILIFLLLYHDFIS